jgi:hypothetical protein
MITFMTYYISVYPDQVVMRRERETTRDTGTDRLYIDNELYVPYEIDKDVTPRLNEEIRDTPKGVNVLSNTTTKTSTSGSMST